MGYWNSVVVYACVFYVVVAFHFRTSTLNLPIDAGSSGFGPFILGYFLFFIMEIMTIILGLQAFHHTRLGIIEDQKSTFKKNGLETKSGDISSVPLIQKGGKVSTISENSDQIVIRKQPRELPQGYDDNLKQEEDFGIYSDFSDDKSIIIDEKEYQSKSSKEELPFTDLSIPSITKYHFPSYFSYPADVIFILALIPLSAGIGVIESFLVIFTDDDDTIETAAMYLLPIFFIATTLLVLVFTDTLAIFLSGTTNINVLAIFVVVILGSIVAFDLSVNDDSPVIVNHWGNILDPIFTAKLTICRNCFILPFLFSRSKPRKSNTRWFMFFSILGLAASFFLTVIWILVVLNIVPQETVDEGKPSLSSARENGELSPVPFSQVVGNVFPSLDFISVVMAIFITFSLVTTYLVNVIALRHIFYGFYNRVIATDFGGWVRRQCLYPKFLYGVFFFWVFVISMTLICQIVFADVGIVLEIFDSLVSLLADLVIMGIIFSDLYFKPRIENGYIISRGISIFLAFSLLIYYVIFLLLNIVHGLIRIVETVSTE